MKSFESVWWLVRTAMTLVIGLLLVRAMAEYVQQLEVLPPVHALVRYWDPLMSDLLQPLGVPWTHDVRGLGTLAVAVALILIRSIVDDMISRAHQPRELPKQAPARPLTAVEEAAAKDAAVRSFAPLPAALAEVAGDSPVMPKSLPVIAEPEPAPVPAPESVLGTMLRTTPRGAATRTGAPVTTTGGLANGMPAPGELPASIGRYDVLGELGRGAMGVVYKGLDPAIGRTVAIKTLSSIPSGPQMQEYKQRFLVEARSAGRLNHPGIVSVYDVTEDHLGRPSLVLEYVAGTPFDTLVADKALGFLQVVDIVAQIARALAHAHGNGIVHRDVKPANIMVTADGQAKLSDFGIAKMDGTGMTQAGQVLGTPAFMSPEQCTGAPLDSRSDIFSLGSVLYQSTTGQRPFPGDTFTSVAYNVVHEMPVPPTRVNPELPAALDRIVWRAMAKVPADRYTSAAELAADLDKLKTQL